MHTNHSQKNIPAILIIFVFVILAGITHTEIQAANSPAASSSTPEKTSDEPDPFSPVERDGITVIVEQVIPGEDKLQIVVKTTGLPPNYFGQERSDSLHDEINEEPLPAQIRLPDGTYLEFTGGGGCEGSGNLTSSELSCQFVFSPLPEGISEFTLEIHRLHMALPGEFPEDWEIPVQLTGIPSSSDSDNVQNPDLRSQTKDGITLLLLQTKQTPSDTAFQLGLEWEGGNRMIHHTAPFILQDQQKHYYILSGGTGGKIHFPENPRENNSNFSLLSTLTTTPISGNEILTFQVDWVIMSLNIPTDLQFTLTDDVQTDQSWTLDEKISMENFDLDFKKVHLKNNPDGSQTFEFEIESPEEIVGVNLSANVQSMSTNSGYNKENDILISSITSSGFHSQPIAFTVVEVLYKVEGPWELTWQPEQVDPASTKSPTPAPTRVAAPTPTIIPSEPLLADLQVLLEKAEKENPKAPGWVHQALEIYQAQPAAMLDTGDLPEQPLHSQTDRWYYLDENGYAQTVITIRKTMDGEIYAADISNGPYHFSIPEGRGSIAADNYLEKPSYNMNLLSTLNGYLQEGGTIRMEDTVVDGHSCQLYEATLPYDSPQIFTGEVLPVSALVYSACVDPANGQVLQTQSQMNYNDGTSRIKGKTRFLSLKKVEYLPDEVNDILDSVIMP